MRYTSAYECSLGLFGVAINVGIKLHKHFPSMSCMNVRYISSLKVLTSNGTPRNRQRANAGQVAHFVVGICSQIVRRSPSGKETSMTSTSYRRAVSETTLKEGFQKVPPSCITVGYNGHDRLCPIAKWARQRSAHITRCTENWTKLRFRSKGCY